MKNFRSRLVGISLILSLSAGFVAAGEKTNKRAKRSQESFKISVLPWGPSQTDVDAAKTRAEQSEAVKSVLQGVKYRLVGFEYIDADNTAKNQPSQPPTRFRAIFYDYTNDRTFVAEGDFAGQETIAVRQETFEPGIGTEELKAAYNVVKKDALFSSLNNAGKLEIYDAMPPTSNLNGERLVNLGVRNLENGENVVVGISFKNEKVVRYENNAPPTSKATPDSCGIASAGQGSTSAGVAGQYQINVSQDSTTLWEMLVIRPSSSSGASGERSGIEVRDVKYKGKSVLKRGHAPILNVQYVSGCGPFRDWQYSEGFFQVPTTDVTYPNGTTGGIALINNGGIATTAIESRNDTGNFQGVAIYQQNVGYGNEIVMVTEMNAGWYRYIMEWRFAADGTIRPRYGFGSTSNSCVCIQRNHHVYWRFDFDIVQPNNNVFQVERGRRFLKPVTNELAIFRNYQLNRGFLIQNATGNEAYQITPNLTDGTVTNTSGVLTDTFGAGDFWLLHFQGTAASPGELDDPNSGSAANLAPWVTGESLVNQDAVIWYGAHQTRIDDTSLNQTNSNIIAGKHVIGPDLRPVRW
jgi:hypothetical protein